MDGHEQQPRLFISYSPQDADFVLWLTESLKSLGHSVWIDREGILGGAQTFEAIQNALDQSDVMLLVMSPHSLKSRLVHNEWTYFLSESGKTLVPILLKPPEPPDKINFMLASLQHVDFQRQDHETAVNVLHSTLNNLYAELQRTTQRAYSSVPSSYWPQNDWGLKDALTVSQAGLLRLHPDLPLALFSNWLQQAHSRIKILNTWSHIFARYNQELLDAIGRGVELQVLLLDPSSPFAKQRSIDMNRGSANHSPDVGEVPKNIRTSIRQMATFYSECENLPGKLELRLYNAMPSFSIKLVDHLSLVGFFTHVSRTDGFPMLEIGVDSPFGARIEAEFEHLWNGATPIDLSPQFPQSMVDINDRLVEPLSKSELEILRLIKAGLSNQQIADKLVVTVATVKKHINNLYSKLDDDVHSRTQAMRRAQELKLL